MWIVFTRTTGRMQHNHRADVEICLFGCLKHIFEAFVAALHQLGKQGGVAVEPQPQAFRHREYNVPIDYAGKQTVSNKIGPSISVATLRSQCPRMGGLVALCVR